MGRESLSSRKRITLKVTEATNPTNTINIRSIELSRNYQKPGLRAQSECTHALTFMSLAKTTYSLPVNVFP